MSRKGRLMRGRLAGRAELMMERWRAGGKRPQAPERFGSELGPPPPRRREKRRWWRLRWPGR